MGVDITDSVSIHPYQVRTRPIESRTEFTSWREKDASYSENSDDLEKVVRREFYAESGIMALVNQQDLHLALVEMERLIVAGGAGAKLRCDT